MIRFSAPPKCAGAESILDPYVWLPSDGESRVEHRKSGNDLIVEIFYSGEDFAGKDIELSKELHFKEVRDFCYENFGIKQSKYSCEGHQTMLGELIEFTQSEAADAWRKKESNATCRHFFIMFLEAEIAMHIFANAFTLQDGSHGK